jgi:hypothetical protein
MFTWHPILIAGFGSFLFVSGALIRSLVRRRSASTEPAPTVLQTMHEMVEEERIA